MKVRTKLGLLLFLVVATFIAGLVGLKAYDQEKFREIAATREAERRGSFDDVIRYWREPLEVFIQYFSVWDDMITAIQKDGPAWAEVNLGDTVLTSYRAQAVWAYRADGNRAFARNVLYSDKLAQVPLPPEAMGALLDRTHRCHYFAQTPVGLMEILGATVHPSRDTALTQGGGGYFFVGRLWTNAEINDIALFTGNTIKLAAPDQPGNRMHQEEPERNSVVCFKYDLPGWDGRALAALSVRNESPIVEQLIRSSDRLFAGFIIFAVVLLLVLLGSLTRWVSLPLHALSEGLQTQGAGGLQKLHPRRDEFGELARMMGNFFEQRQSLLREMNDRRAAEEKLHESEERLRHSQKMEAVGRLAGGVAHDFNNLLTAIVGYAELISIRSLDAQIREEAALIRKAGEQAADLTKQLLAFSRKQILQPRVLDLNALVRDMQKLLRRIIGEAIELQFEIAEGEARVSADPTQLEQVVLNLAVNARDAMPRGGRLTIRTGEGELTEAMAERAGQQIRPGRYYTLAAEDTGCGMDAATQARIFEPFFTTKGLGEGTGLGLATVYGIVTQSGGAILVHSEVGEGTTFTVHLPQVQREIERLPAVAPLPKLDHRATVLVVEDELIVRELVCAVLSSQGYDVLCAESGFEALRLAEENGSPIDLLVSDVVMPQMTGPEVARELLATSPQTKVLFVSGYSEADISHDGILSPGTNLLPKPFTADVLTRRVRQVLEGNHQP